MTDMQLPDDAFEGWLRDEKLPMVGEKISLPLIESLIRKAWAEGAKQQREIDAGIAEGSTLPKGHRSLNEGSRSQWYAHGRRDSAAAIRNQGSQ